MAGSLRQNLRERIGFSGPLPFADFMQAALYHPSDGYYATRVPGRGGHYRTSPSLTPWFGRLVAREFRRMWQALDRPAPFWVIEAGGGHGDLAADAMQEANSIGVPLRWRFVERFARVQNWQRRRLGPAAGAAEWSTVGGAGRGGGAPPGRAGPADGTWGRRGSRKHACPSGGQRCAGAELTPVMTGLIASAAATHACASTTSGSRNTNPGWRSVSSSSNTRRAAAELLAMVNAWVKLSRQWNLQPGLAAIAAADPHPVSAS